MAATWISSNNILCTFLHVSLSKLFPTKQIFRWNHNTFFNGKNITSILATLTIDVICVLFLFLSFAPECSCFIQSMIYNPSAQRDVPGYKSSGSRCFVGQFAQGFPSGSDNKESACNARDTGSIPELGRSPGEEWLPTPVFYPENPMDRGAWWATAHGVAKNQAWLSN